MGAPHTVLGTQKFYSTVAQLWIYRDSCGELQQHGRTSAWKIHNSPLAWKCVSTVQLLGQGMRAHSVNAD